MDEAAIAFVFASGGEPMKIVLFGATGNVGRRVAAEALPRGTPASSRPAVRRGVLT
jgi:hypothetical protein